MGEEGDADRTSGVFLSLLHWKEQATDMQLSKIDVIVREHYSFGHCVILSLSRTKESSE